MLMSLPVPTSPGAPPVGEPKVVIPRYQLHLDTFAVSESRFEFMLHIAVEVGPGAKTTIQAI